MLLSLFFIDKNVAVFLFLCLLANDYVTCWHLAFYVEFNFMKERLKDYLKKFAEEDKVGQIFEPCLLLTVCVCVCVCLPVTGKLVSGICLLLL